MAFFDNIKNMKDSITKAATDVTNNISVVNEEQRNLSKINTELSTLNKEIDSACTQIGRKYLEYVIENQEMPGIDISDILKALDPKMSRKEELEKEVIEIQKRLKDQTIVQEKNAAEQDFRRQKVKLDKALAMDVISQQEYDEKILVARRRVDNFEQIKKIEQQYELGIISESEKNMKISQLL